MRTTPKADSFWKPPKDVRKAIKRGENKLAAYHKRIQAEQAKRHKGFTTV
jgi:hypothetical protein